MPQRHVVIYLNTLLDTKRYRANFADGVARIMRERYGGKHASWLAVQQIIFADWASYHADLNYSGDDGMADIREGQFRVTRALFRLSNTPEPVKADITALAQTLISEAPCTGDSFTASAQHFLQVLSTRSNVKMTVTSYFCTAQIRAILEASGHPHIAVIGADTFEHYEMDAHYFRCLQQYLQPNTQASKRIYFDTRADTLKHAQSAGFDGQLITPNTSFADCLHDLQSVLT